MPVLYTLLGIILFFVLIFSLRVSVIIDYGEKTLVKIKYLFITIPIVDTSKEKKPKKEKKKKAGETATTEQTETTTQQPENKKQGNSFLKQLYIDQGYEGIEKMLFAVKESLGSFFGKLYKTFTINEFYLTMHITGSDAADTAIKYGKLSAWLFPFLGKVASTCKMKKYDIDISPDFLGVKNEADLYLNVSVVPIRITNAAIVLAFQLIVKVILKILFAGNKAKKSVNINTKTTENSSADATNSADTNM